MSGFRKFRTTLQRRRKAELLGLSRMEPIGRLGGMNSVAVAPLPGTAASSAGEPESTPLEFSPSVEAREIGPAPIAWLKTRRTEVDH